MSPRPAASPSKSADAPPRKSANERERVRNLITLDSGNILSRLESRKDEMISLFSRLRDRSALLDPLKSWFPSATFQELHVLQVEEQIAANAFYEAVERLRWYFQYTVDMPGTAQQTFELHHRRLREAHEQLSQVLAPAPAKKPAPKNKRAGKRPSRRK